MIECEYRYVDGWPKTMRRTNIYAAMSNHCVPRLSESKVPDRRFLEQNSNWFADSLKQPIQCVVVNFSQIRFYTRCFSISQKWFIDVALPKYLRARMTCVFRSAQVRWHTRRAFQSIAIDNEHDVRVLWARCGRPHVVQVATGKFYNTPCLSIDLYFRLVSLFFSRISSMAVYLGFLWFSQMAYDTRPNIKKFWTQSYWNDRIRPLFLLWPTDDDEHQWILSIE